MHLTETVTIINNSGKVISTGRQLVNIFKEAKASYHEKKAAIKAERYGSSDPWPGQFRRAQTFDVGPRYEYEGEDEHDEYVDERGYGHPHELPYHASHHHHRYIEDNDAGRRRSVDDGRSHASSRWSHRSHRSHRTGGGSEHGSSRHSTTSSRPSRTALTESNLRTLSEISATAPSAAPKAYHSPYAETETVPRDMTLSRPTFAHPAGAGAAPGTVVTQRPVPHHSVSAPMPPPSEATQTAANRDSTLVHRPRSDPSLRGQGKEVDMHLAYGNVPPDLATRVDLDAVSGSESDEEEGHEVELHHMDALAVPSPDDQQKEAEARTLMGRIEAVLVEAQCLHHSATSIIAHLQGDPEAAAAVALTLAELSALLGKMSPGFLAVVKGGWPAIFALLASPQFLVGVGVAVGVTVVCFGGWKIVKRIKEAKAAREDALAQAQAFEMQPQQAQAQEQEEPLPEPPSREEDPGRHPQQGYAPPGRGPASFDEALVIEEELSSIEAWRRGIPPFGEGESAVSVELITPDAVRSVMEDQRTLGGDTASRRSGRTHRSGGGGSKKHRSKSEHKSRHLRSSRRAYSDEGYDEPEVPERRSSARAPTAAPGGGGEGKSRREGSEHGDAQSVGSRRSSRSKGSGAVGLKAIEDAREDEDALETVLRKEKKSSMLKQLFKKKKDRDDRERSEVAVSVLV